MLLDRIRDRHVASGGTYGAPRIRADLGDEGHHVATKRVAQLMRVAGLRGESRRTDAMTTTPGSEWAPPDPVERDFTATAPDQLRKSLTWDQGTEMAQHPRLKIDTGLEIYFCDPRSPWQRGTNENTNGLLRQYFPKGTDVSRYSEYKLDAVAATLNSRPRKTLDWSTPAEAFNRLLSSAQETGFATTH